MSKKYLFLALVFIFSVFTTLFAQTKVSGMVVDKNNQPVPFANVVLKGSNRGVMSNEDGRFYIESPNTYNILVVSSVGFSDKEITLEKSSKLQF